MAWRVWLFDGLTGVLDREINIGSFSWKVTVSDSSFDTAKDRNVGKDEFGGVSLPWEVFGDVSESERRDLVAPYRRGLCLFWEDNRKRLFPIVAGIVSNLSEKRTEAQISLDSPLAVLSRRFMVHDNEFGMNAEHTAPGVFEYKGLSLRAIACHVIDVCTNRRKNGRLPLELPYLREQGTHERTYKDNDIQNLLCADILKKIANVQDGVDMQFRPVYDESSRRIFWRFVAGDDVNKTISTTNTHYFINSQRLQTLQDITIDHSNHCNRIYSVGATPENQELSTVAMVENMSMCENENPYIMTEACISDSETENYNLLRGHALNLLDAQARPLIQIKGSFNLSDISDTTGEPVYNIGRIFAGERADVLIKNFPTIRERLFECRIMELSGNNSDTVNIVFDVMPDPFFE